MQVLGVVGWSGSGKTTLLEFLIAELGRRGKTLNVIKHSHHDVVLESPHKDSARFRAAGAVEVMLVSPYRYAIVRELHAQPEPELQTLVSRLSAADLVLVEGYKWAAISKLEVFRPSVGKEANYPADSNILAVASDVARPATAREGLVWLDLNQPASIVDWIIGAMQNENLSRF